MRKVTDTCAVCGKKFSYIKGKGRDRATCSKECHAEHHKHLVLDSYHRKKGNGQELNQHSEKKTVNKISSREIAKNIEGLLANQGYDLPKGSKIEIQPAEAKCIPAVQKGEALKFRVQFDGVLTIIPEEAHDGKPKV